MTIKDLIAAGVSVDAEIFIGHYNDGQKRVSQYDSARVVRGSAFASCRDARKVVSDCTLDVFDNSEIAVILYQSDLPPHQ